MSKNAHRNTILRDSVKPSSHRSAARTLSYHNAQFQASNFQKYSNSFKVCISHIIISVCDFTSGWGDLHPVAVRVRGYRKIKTVILNLTEVAFKGVICT